jgi:hypothetical protein
MDAPPSYREAHRYDGAAVEHGGRCAVETCAIQPRDIGVLRDAWRYKFLTAPQLRELWWASSSVQAADRRLLKLFRGGYLERFRPYARRGLGSFPWTYYLGENGHRLLREADIVPQAYRYRRRAIFDFGHVLHEIQLNAWVLAYRRAIGRSFLSWDGETQYEPPSGLRADRVRLDDDWSVEGISEPRPHAVYPDAVLEISGEKSGAESRLIFVEYDRTRRLDKNYDKFRRYDAFLTWWWRHTPLGFRVAPPFLLFVCQDDDQRDLFLAAADEHLTGHRWHPDAEPGEYEYGARRRTLFVSEIDAHAGLLEARRLPEVPRGHADRHDAVRRVELGIVEKHAA